MTSIIIGSQLVPLVDVPTEYWLKVFNSGTGSLWHSPLCEIVEDRIRIVIRNLALSMKMHNMSNCTCAVANSA